MGSSVGIFMLPELWYRYCMSRSEKLFIQNRDGKQIAVVIEQPDEQSRGLAFVMHGQGGFKEQKHIRTFAKTFLDRGLITVTFDTRDTLGESEGLMENVTVSGSLQDLEDVIQWARPQPWYQEPFVLAGHSLGSMTILLYAEDNPDMVKALAPTSAALSGELMREVIPQDALAAWRETGWYERPSTSKPGVIKRIKYAFIEDAMQYDVLSHVDRLRMPIVLVVGSDDTSTPVEQQQKLFEALPGPKELHIIAGAPHTFREEKHLAEIRQIIGRWIDSWV